MKKDMKMEVQRIQNNNTTFGIKANKKQCQKVLGRLNPERKKPFDVAISRFCEITQKHGVKGTFYPVKIKNVRDDVVLLEYKIIDLHNNGGNNIFKYKNAIQNNSSSAQRNNFTVNNEVLLWKHSDSKSYLDQFLFDVRDALSKQQ